MGMKREQFDVERNYVVLIAEMGRQAGDLAEFCDALWLREPLATRLEMFSLSSAVRTFQEASREPLQALVAARNAKVRRIGR